MMKVLIHLDHHQDKSYLLGFGAKVTTHQVRQLLQNPRRERTIQKLITHSGARMSVSPNDKKKAKMLANFVVSDNGYTAERLA